MLSKTNQQLQQGSFTEPFDPQPQINQVNYNYDFNDTARLPSPIVLPPKIAFSQQNQQNDYQQQSQQIRQLPQQVINVTQKFSQPLITEQYDAQPQIIHHHNICDFNDTVKILPPIVMPLQITNSFIQQCNDNQLSQQNVQIQQQNNINQSNNSLLISQLQWMPYINLPNEKNDNNNNFENMQCNQIQEQVENYYNYTTQNVNQSHMQINSISRSTPSNRFPIIEGPVPAPNIDEEKRKEFERRKFQEYLYNFGVSNEAYILPPPSQALQIQENLKKTKANPNQIDPLQSLQNYINANSSNTHNTNITVINKQKQFYQQAEKENEDEIYFDESKEALPLTEALQLKYSPSKQQISQTSIVNLQTVQPVQSPASTSTQKFLKTGQNEKAQTVQLAPKLQNTQVMKQINADDELPKSEYDFSEPSKSQQSFYSTKKNKALVPIQEEITLSGMYEKNAQLQQQQQKLDIPELPSWKQPKRCNAEADIIEFKKISKFQQDPEQVNERINDQIITQKTQINEQNQRYLEELQLIIEKYDNNDN